MIGARLALLAGLFGAPLILLWLGHHMRGRTPRQKGAFWGGLIGHTTGLVLTTVLAITPPVVWHDGSIWRDFAVHWSMLAGFVLGTSVGALRAPREPGGPAHVRRDRAAAER